MNYSIRDRLFITAPSPKRTFINDYDILGSPLYKFGNFIIFDAISLQHTVDAQATVYQSLVNPMNINKLPEDILRFAILLYQSFNKE